MKTLNKIMGVAAAALLLAACNDSDDDGGMVVTTKYEITVMNLTAGQPFSPPVLVLHDTAYHAFQEGKVAGVGVEYIAESGNSAELVLDLKSRNLNAMIADGSGPILPGKSRMYTLETMKSMENLMSMVSMLGKTNDGFTGADSLKLEMMPGETMTWDMPAWDAGTEANTETAATLGAAGGQGYDPMRDDKPGVVTIHPGVMGNAENPSSALTEKERFDNPVLRLSIRRLM